MKIPRRLSFSALLSPAGVHVVSYRRGAAALAIHAYARDLEPRSDPAEAAAALADLLEACGASGRRVALCVSGFGVCHQILPLPPAGREVLGPVVTREMRRFFPDLFAEPRDPLVAFAGLVPDSSEESGPREVLAAAVPRALLHEVAAALRARAIELEHWTVLPRAVQRLHEAYVGDHSTSATALLLPGAAVVAFFHAGSMRLFSEPFGGSAGLAAGGAQDAVAEQLRRGNLYLRQQYRGASLHSLALAAEPGEATEIGGVAERHGLPVTALGPLHGNPGALAALAAALDAAEPDALDLLPPELRPATRAERSARGLVLASVAVLAAGSSYWAWSASRLADTEAARVGALRAELAPRAAAYAALRPLVRERQAHAARVRLLSDLVASNRRLPEALWPLQAAGPAITLQRLDVQRGRRGWNVAVAGTAEAPSSAGATDAVDALVQQIAAQLPGGTVSLDGLEFAPAGADTLQRESAVAVGFRLTFVVPGPLERG